MHVYMEYECAGKATQQDTHIGGRPRLSAGWLAGYAHRGREGGRRPKALLLSPLPPFRRSECAHCAALPSPPPISCLWATFAAAVVAALLAEIEREEDAGAGVGGGRERR